MLKNLGVTGLRLFTGCLLMVSQLALSANVLFVADNNNDIAIVTVLQNDGHTVTTVTNDYVVATTDNVVLQSDLSAYDAVFWSADAGGGGGLHINTTTINLQNYVSNGGKLLITGQDSIASPTDLSLITLLGGTATSYDISSITFSAIAGSNSLTTGVKSIIGLVPVTDSYDFDGLSATELGGGAACVSSVSSNSEVCLISLRSLGSGEVAFVSNGRNSGEPDTTSWATDANDGTGVFNAIIRNFANSATPPAPQNANQPGYSAQLQIRAGNTSIFLLFMLAVVFFSRAVIRR